MSAATLPPDSTLFSIKGPLNEEYVRRILKSLWECEREMGNAQVRISLEASPMPDYAIEALVDDDAQLATPWKSFSGRTHRLIGDAARARTIWSSEPTSRPQISELIGSLRKR